MQLDCTRCGAVFGFLLFFVVDSICMFIVFFVAHSGTSCVHLLPFAFISLLQLLCKSLHILYTFGFWPRLGYDKQILRPVWIIFQSLIDG